jgi:hypothetical protein
VQQLRLRIECVLQILRQLNISGIEFPALHLQYSSQGHNTMGWFVGSSLDALSNVEPDELVSH